VEFGSGASLIVFWIILVLVLLLGILIFKD
jgi:hypothetical protein